jgi:hypothetical protein
MSNWQIVIPIIGPRQNLEECIASMGEIPVPLLIVDNSPDSFTNSMKFPKTVGVEYYPANLGVAASWNRGLMRGAKWTMILSSSVRFNGQLARLVSDSEKRTSLYGLNFRMGFHVYVVGEAMTNEIGVFDENYWPIYEEDIDYWRRAILAGITGCGTSEIPYFHPDYLACIGDAMALKSGSVKVDFSKNQQYMIRKWKTLAPHGDDAYKTPFGNPTNPLSYWEKPQR